VFTIVVNITILSSRWGYHYFKVFTIVIWFISDITILREEEVKIMWFGIRKRWCDWIM